MVRYRQWITGVKNGEYKCCGSRFDSIGLSNAIILHNDADGMSNPQEQFVISHRKKQKEVIATPDAP